MAFSGVKAYLTASDLSVADETWTEIDFAGVVFDEGDATWWDSGGDVSRLVVPADGWYTIIANSGWKGDLQGEHPSHRIMKNGTTVLTLDMFDMGSTDWNLHNTVVTAYLETGDELSLEVWQSSGSNKNLWGGAGHTFLAAFLVPTYDYDGVRVNRTAAYTLAQNTDVLIAWDTEEWDSSSYWGSGAPTKLVAPYDGFYLVFGATGFDDTMGDSSVRTDYLVNDSSSYRMWGSSEKDNFLVWTHATVFELSAGDYVEMDVYQTEKADAAWNVSTPMHFGMQFLGSTGSLNAIGDYSGVGLTLGGVSSDSGNDVQATFSGVLWEELHDYVDLGTADDVITIPANGYYNIMVNFGWTETIANNEGRCWIEVNGTEVAAFDESPSDSLGTILDKWNLFTQLYLLEDDEVTIWFRQWDGTRTIDAGSGLTTSYAIVQAATVTQAIGGASPSQSRSTQVYSMHGIDYQPAMV